MTELNFVLLDAIGYAEFCSWFENEELRRRISLPTSVWFDYVRQTPGVYAWMIYDATQPVGEVQLDIIANNSGATGHIALVVNPDLWQQGWCKRILRALLKRPELAALTTIEAHVEPDNIASQRCLQFVGFAKAEIISKEGMLIYSYRR
jgi:RimJ/RimL family protein N-acetyltransferase